MFSQPKAAPRPALVSDMQLDVRSSRERVFRLIELSDAMKRGVRLYRFDGTPSDRLNSVLDALIFDGEVFFDDSTGTAPLGN